MGQAGSTSDSTWIAIFYKVLSNKDLEHKHDPAGGCFPTDVGIGIVFRSDPTVSQTSSPGVATSISVLITRRKEGGIYGGFWEFPGGKAAPGEPFDACVRRELAEEVGIAVEVVGVLSSVEHTYPHGRVRLHPRLCRLLPGSAEVRNLHVAEHRWVHPDELSGYRFPEANEAIIRALLQWLTQAGPSDLGVAIT